MIMITFMSILLLKLRKIHFLFLIIISFFLPSFSESQLKPEPFLSISTRGFITGKFRDFNLDNPVSGLNNHGAFYSEVIPGLYYNKSNFLSLGFYLKNDEFSVRDWISFSPLFYANIGNDSSDSFFRWNVRSGMLPFTTVGCGLTIKDFRQIGTQGSISLGDFSLLTNIWAQGYTKNEDIIWFNMSYEKFPVRLNAILWNIGESVNPFESGMRYYFIIYALPYVEKRWRNFDFYLEYGYKYKERKNTSAPHEAHALLYGLSYTDTLFNFKVTVNPEFRYYGKGFIPNTGVSEKFFGSLDTWYHSTNNWVDFFNSKEKSIWLYLKLYLETPSFKGFSIYFHDELLIFKSSQKTILAKMQFDTDTYLAFNPSTNFYKAGLKYTLLNFINISFNISNQLLNVDPFMRSLIKYRQYMERFYPTDKLFFELLLQWQIDNVMRKR